MRDRPASAPPSANGLFACATGCSGSPCAAPATGPGSPQPAARSNAPPYAESCLAVYGRDSGGHIQAALRQRERGGIRYRFPPADAAAVAALPHRRRRNAGREVGSCPLPAVGQHDRITAHPDNAARVTQARQLLCGAGRPERDRRTPIAAEGAEISQFARDVRQEPALPTQPRRLACPSPRGTCGRCPAEVFGWAQIVMIRQPLLAMLAGRGVPHGLTHTGLPRCRPGSAPTVVLRGGFRPRRRSASWALGERLDGVGRRSSEATGNRRATQRSTTPRAATARREPCRPVPRGTSRSRSAPSRVPRGTRQCRNDKARRTGLC